MARELTKGEAVDLSNRPRNRNGDYILTRPPEEKDYCDAKTEMWIWSIGRNRRTGQTLASLDTKFYWNPRYECLWLR